MNYKTAAQLLFYSRKHEIWPVGTVLRLGRGRELDRTTPPPLLPSCGIRDLDSNWDDWPCAPAAIDNSGIGMDACLSMVLVIGFIVGSVGGVLGRTKSKLPWSFDGFWDSSLLGGVVCWALKLAHSTWQMAENMSFETKFLWKPDQSVHRKQKTNRYMEKQINIEKQSNWPLKIDI